MDKITNKRNNLQKFIAIAWATFQIDDCDITDLQEMWWALFIKYQLQFKTEARLANNFYSVNEDDVIDYFYDKINTKNITEQSFRIICLECIEPRPETATDLILKRLKEDLNPSVIFTSPSIESK